MQTKQQIYEGLNVPFDSPETNGRVKEGKGPSARGVSFPTLVGHRLLI